VASSTLDDPRHQLKKGRTHYPIHGRLVEDSREHWKDIFVSDLPAKLRQLRNERKITQITVARAINVSKSLIASFEQGRLIPQYETVDRLDTFYGTGDTLSRMSADAVAERERQRDRRQRQLPVFDSWADLEASATMLRSFQPLLIPGLLQTEGYALATLESSVTLDPTDIHRHVTDRMARQEILNSPKPPRFMAVIDQTALRRKVGTPLIMRDQCDALLKACLRPHVSIQMVPEDAGAYAGTNGPFVLAMVGRETYGFVEDQLGGRVVDVRDEVDLLMRAWDEVKLNALNQRQSLDLIARMAETWK
jgi:transcriptional regulator with XRE-family HTH domain